MEFYRYGGEEFVAVAYERDAARLTRTFENIVAAVAILQVPNNDDVVTVSQGVFLLPADLLRDAPPLPGDLQAKPAGDDMNVPHFQQYLSKADEALYRAKEQGRNRTIIY